jgi:hypothetical protein
MTLAWPAEPMMTILSMVVGFSGIKSGTSVRLTADNRLPGRKKVLS